MLSAVACRSVAPDERQRIPPAPVWYLLDLMGEGYALMEPISMVSIEHPRTAEDRVGYGGLVVVHLSGIGEPFCAYEAACPYDWPTVVSVQPMPEKQLPEGTLLAVQCPRCGTVYDLTLGLGQPLNGPARLPLTPYRCRRVGDRLLITN